MSNFRGLIPIVLATAMGIGNGIYVFDPAFKEQNQRKLKEQHPEPQSEAAVPANNPAAAGSANSESGSSSVSKDPKPAQMGAPISSSSSWLASWSWPWSGQKGEDAQPKNGTPQLPAQKTAVLDSAIDNKKP